MFHTIVALLARPSQTVHSLIVTVTVRDTFPGRWICKPTDTGQRFNQGEKDSPGWLSYVGDEIEEASMSRGRRRRQAQRIQAAYNKTIMPNYARVN